MKIPSSLTAALFCVLLAPSPVVADAAGPINFSLDQLGGGTVAVSDYLGEWVIINYWATWCAPCRKEIPELSELHVERNDVTVLGLAFEDTDEAAFEDFLGDFDVTYPILRVDVYQPPEPFGAPKVLPTTIVLNPQGMEAHSFFGPVTRKNLEDVIDGKIPAGQP